MKTNLLILFAVTVSSIYVHSQTIGDVLNSDSLNFYEKIILINDNNREIFDSSSLAEQKRFYRWQTFWSKRVDTAGFHFAYPLMVMDYMKTKSTKYSNTIFPEFFEIGPYDNQVVRSDNQYAKPNNIGRMMSVAVHPTNPNIVYAGSAYGGVYKTTNATVSFPSDVVWTRS